MIAPPKLPEILEKIADKVLAYKPKAATKAAKKRAKATRSFQKQSKKNKDAHQ
jgi:hypothetical protein